MDERKFRIAYFQQDGLITGSAISLRHFLNALDKSRFEPIVILAKEGPARGLYESIGVTVKIYSFATFWTFPGPRCFSRGMLKQLKALIPNVKLRDYIINDIKPDIIHINDKASINVGLSVKNMGIPIVQHSRSSYIITQCLVAKYLSKHSIQNYADYIIAISEDEEDGFENVNRKAVIYNTVDFKLVKEARDKKTDTRNNLNVKGDEILVGFAANITEKKGAWDFLELCKRLKNLQQVKFIMVGELSKTGNTYLNKNVTINKSPYEFVLNYLKENNLENRMIVTGFRQDNLDLIAAMDILIVPNKNGVLGRQPIEAQALGTTVIAQKGHSNKSKIIHDGITGFYVNDIIEAHEKIVHIINNHVKTEIDARKYAELNFNPDINIKKIENIYLNLIKF
jgi:glycosyltransferase involved in cell wall biosynthesis